jgi:hypothetical protein
MDIIRYLSTYIPREIEVDGKSYFFSLFINHPHYDIRFSYGNEDADPSFHYLYENIDSETSLMECLADLRIRLQERGLLRGGYATPEGYSTDKYLAFMNAAKDERLRDNGGFGKPK